MSYKIAFSGKGGVGKTTLCAALSLYLAEKGKKVLAVDVDPDANLATALGLPETEAEKITPISDMKELVRERTGSTNDAPPGFFIINPEVDDIPDKYSSLISGVRLMVMGSIDTGGGGCICPENALVRALIKNLLLKREEVVVMDMEAGIEHLGRSTAEAVDMMIVVVEPGRRSLDTAKRIVGLAGDIGLKNIYLVLNKLEDDKQIKLLDEINLPVLATISADKKVREADEKGKAVYPSDDKFNSQINEFAKKIEEVVNE